MRTRSTSSGNGRTIAANTFIANPSLKAYKYGKSMESRPSRTLFFSHCEGLSMKHPGAPIALLLVLSQSSCIAVGYSSNGGWLLWPGGLGLILLIIVVVLILRRLR